ncbi:MAG: glycosyltransferase [Candidatus Gastranaerophilales bacterium]|nr:glycosyltransferase [Candidatus Gastranaerophilales bacterium]
MQTNNTTIIIPTRTIDFLLKECISKIRELYETVKIIVIVDEFSEDETSVFDSSITFLKSENRNMSAKRNLGVKYADTDYVAFIDSDAYPNKNWIEAGTEFLSKNADYVAVTGNQLIPQDDDFEKQCLRQIKYSRLFTYEKWCKIINLDASEQDCFEFTTSSLIMRREDYLKHNGMKENIYLTEDNEFSSRLVAKSGKIRFLPQMRVFHHESSYLPFMKKIFSISFYYTTVKEKHISAETLSEKIRIFFPLISVIIVILLFLISIALHLNLLINLIIPFAVFVVFSAEAIRISAKIKQNRIKSYFMLMYLFVSFCIFYLLGQTAGLLHFKGIKAENLYRHY